MYCMTGTAINLIISSFVLGVNKKGNERPSTLGTIVDNRPFLTDSKLYLVIYLYAIGNTITIFQTRVSNFSNRGTAKGRKFVRLPNLLWIVDSEKAVDELSSKHVNR